MKQKRVVLIVEIVTIAAKPFVDMQGIKQVVVEAFFMVLVREALKVYSIVIERYVHHNVASCKCQGTAASGKVFPAIAMVLGKQVIVDD